MTGEQSHNPALNSAANYHFWWPWMKKSESELKQSRAEDLNSSHYLIKFEWIFTKLGDLYSGLHRNVLQVWDLMKLCIDIDKIGDNISFSLKVVVVEKPSWEPSRTLTDFNSSWICSKIWIL